MNKVNSKISLFHLLLMSLFFFSFSALSIDITNQTLKKHKIFKGEMNKAWNSLVIYSPKQAQLLENENVYPKQFLGGVKNGFLLKPHWANDLAADIKFRQQLKAYGLAFKAIDNGQLTQAVNHLNKFLLVNKDSLLKPIVIYAKALSHLGLGQNLLGLDSLHRFSVEFPNHPLQKNVAKLMQEVQ